MQAIKGSEELKVIEQGREGTGYTGGCARYFFRKRKNKPTIKPRNLCGKGFSHGLVIRGDSVFFSRFSQRETMDGPVPNRVYATNISCLKGRSPETSEKREALHLLDTGPKKRRKKRDGNRTFEDNLKKNSFRRGTISKVKEFSEVDRVYRVLVMTNPVPLRMVTSVDHFKQAVRDLVLARHLVFTSKARIFYRDLNINSLMVRYHDDGSICGVLVDLDLVEVHRDATEEFTGTQTGTRLFMAWELLESDPPSVHLERYDWEPFFYIISWIGCRFSEGKEVNSSALADWTSPNDKALLSAKQAWLYGPYIMRWFTKFYEDVASNWIYHMQMLFKAGNDAMTNFMVRQRSAKPGDPILNEKFDKDTFGGHITWDKLWKILQN